MTRIRFTRGEARLIAFAVGTSLLIGASTISPLPAHGATADQPDEPVFGNTITIDIPGVFTARRYMDPDHSWRQTSDSGDSRGTWQVVGDKLCFTQIEPVPDASRPAECPPNSPHKLGDKWINIDPMTGNTVDIQLVAGRP